MNVPLIFDPADDMVIVFRLPVQLPGGFCFGGGYPVNFQMVDWFNGSPDPFTNRVPTEDDIRAFIRKKQYATGPLLVLRRSGSSFLVLP